MTLEDGQRMRNLRIRVAKNGGCWRVYNGVGLSGDVLRMCMRRCVRVCTHTPTAAVSA